MDSWIHDVSGPAITPTIQPPTVPSDESRAEVLASFVAVDAASRRVLADVERLAAMHCPVLIRGERGTGKDLLASILHRLSAEHDAPFINVDCSWLPPRRFEAELFGDERTDTARRGLLDLIGNGTLVLNEVAALPMSLQARLLRVLDHGTAERVGGSRPFTVAARIVAITRVDLEHAVARRAFRTDLFYALSATSIVVPPLRQRPADVAPLSDHFLARFSELHRHGPKRIVPEVRDALVAYEFAGNVAELQSILEHAMVKCVGDEITLDALPLHLRTCGCRDALSLEEVERAHIASVLRQVAGRKSEAAAILGISRKTLLEKRKRYRLE